MEFDLWKLRGARRELAPSVPRDSWRKIWINTPCDQYVLPMPTPHPLSPMVFLWFSNGFLMVFLWFPFGFRMVPNCFPIVSLMFPYGFRMVFLWFSYGFPIVSLVFPIVSLFFPYCFFSHGLPMGPLMFSYGFRMVSLWFPMVCLWFPVVFPWFSYGSLPLFNGSAVVFRIKVYERDVLGICADYA